MKKKLVAISLVILGMMTAMGCSNKKQPNKETGKLRVGVTISPLKEFAEIIGGDKIQVTSIIPDGSEPHDFEPKPQDLEAINNSDVFIYNGLGMEHWIDSVLDTIGNKDIEIVDSSVGVNILKTDGKDDPHVWLSLKEATKQAENIKNALVKKDSANKEFYEANFNTLKKDFEMVYSDYKTKFEGISNKDFITGHAAFGYLCRDFGLTQKSIADIYGEGELTPKTLEDLVNYCKENKVKTIFSESTASSKESETLAKEAGAKVEKIYSLETKEEDKTYLDGMKYNLDKILEALK
ncbi:metal ABC transporter solute-binding protein, Zn/Mn family [Clostridium chauvoei]|uniref:Zinc ABC transporter substrate-binding protein n=2 Tax=Clostridium chauvoei TaxID=46867 RepID=A0ABD4RG01_9CLOT|nr:zinc ABC transporter substrate-binding protein [Clostridium chauvoei]ATD55882.1 ABC transporter substrate-binding protein [Clostridium chauvoei]ATD56446.1 ABC transporter substrate-binding protein [Clostridium chauvoei]MBX7280245.1 zinc ABC transporter substrate-binding protein [Clostridium chauvoei]MBX7282645.1 zinc ABC transporter substrate-binding protein [Clostridium chauvoei]MBX7285136.1 zinc ABC transporter substrate-binding protein [Clostridium chauvoei]